MRSASDGKPEKSLVGPAGRRGGLAALTAGQRRVAACRFCFPKLRIRSGACEGCARE